MPKRTFEQLQALARDALVAHPDLQSILISSSWDDYNDETYDRETFGVQYKPAAAGGVSGDYVPALRALERQYEPLIETLTDRLSLAKDGWSRRGQEQIEILFKKDLTYSISLSNTGYYDNQEKEFYSFEDLVSYLDNRPEADE